MNRFSSLGWMAVIVTLTITLFGGLVAADPPLPPNTGGAQNQYIDAPTLQSCSAGMDQFEDGELAYCDDLHVHRKTKEIVGCSTSGVSGGDWDNPDPFSGRNHNCWNFNTHTETRTYLVCGENDGEENGVRVSNDISTPELTDDQLSSMSESTLGTTDVSEDDWSCPSVKPLSMRHDKGTLDPQFSLSGAGFESLDNLHFESGSDMSFRQTIVIPACVNRVPMTKTDIDLKEKSSGDTVSEKSSISASHMNMYYGPEGDNRGAVKEVSLPEQTAFKKKYSPEATLKSYRMWAWRQRFAGALDNVVDDNSLTLPEEEDVSELADEYGDTGVSVGDLWLTADFLFGDEATDQDGATETITRQISSKCSVDVRDFSEFDTVTELDTYVSDNEGGAIDLFGKAEGDNYCDIGVNETLESLGEVSNSGAFEETAEEAEGTVSTTILTNFTFRGEEATINITDIGDDSVENASEFMDLYENTPEDALTFIQENKGRLSIDHIGDSMITEVTDATEENDDEVTVEVTVERWPTGAEAASYETDSLYDAVDAAYLDDQGYPEDGTIQPSSVFDERNVTGVHEATDAGSTFEVNMTFNTRVITSENYLAYVDITTVIEEEQRSSWNWRALEEVSMTDLARCLYNWESCVENTRTLDSASYDGEEINDAGFGPRQGTWLYSWSEDAAEDATDELSENYDTDVSADFNKYYDGAAGTEDYEPMDVTVFRTCESDEGWLNEETAETRYEDDMYLCPDGTVEYGASVELSSDTVLASSTSDTVEFRVDADERVSGFDAEISLENPAGATIEDASLNVDGDLDVEYREEDTLVVLEATSLEEDLSSLQSLATVTVENDEAGPVGIDVDASVQNMEGHDLAVEHLGESVTETAYRCGSWSGNMPSWAAPADIGDYKMLDGEYYECRGGTTPTWELDDREPSVTCDDCISPNEAPIGNEISVDVDVERQGAPIDRTAVCWDQNCEDVIFEGTSGSFTVDEPTDATLWIQVEDLQGNVNSVELGSLRVARAIGESCEADNECLSGLCQDFECVADESPIIDIF